MITTVKEDVKSSYKHGNNASSCQNYNHLQPIELTFLSLTSKAVTAYRATYFVLSINLPIHIWANAGLTVCKFMLNYN